MSRRAFNTTVAREARISRAILEDPALLALVAEARLRKQDFETVVAHADEAEAANAAQGVAAGQANDSGARDDVAELAKSLTAFRQGVQLALADARDALDKKGDGKLARDVAAVAGARFASKAKRRKKAAAPAPAEPAGGTPMPENRHASRSADSVVAEAGGWAALVRDLKALKPFLKARGVDKKAIAALKAEARAVRAKKGESVSLHAAVHLATADEHAAVEATHRAWAKIAPTLRRLGRQHPEIAALLGT